MRHYDHSWRSTRDAFPIDRAYAIERYRAPWLVRWWWAIARLTLVSVLFGVIGVLLAWRG